MRDSAKILTAKRRLYAALLELEPEEWSDIEAEIGAALAKDEQIQAFIASLEPPKGD